MKTTLDPNSRLLTVQVPGDLVSTNADALRAAVDPYLEPEPAKAGAWEVLQLELAGAKMVDSVGLNLMVTILRAAQKLNRRMRVTYANPNVLRTFQFTRLDQHIELIKL